MAGQGARTLRPEDEISHYRIVGPLGAGGMGEVYLAQDQSLERNVALKILPPELVRSEERVRRFVLEAKSASSLSHPNIVTIYEIGQDAVRSAGEPDSDPLHFISMELVSGRTLSTLIHDDQTDLRTLLGYLAQAADGLAKAHAAGIVHRDLKPGNIMVSADGFAKVLDFGLAKLTEKREARPEVSSAPTRMADVTAEGIVVGTVAYMAPEQVLGKVVDHRSDIFSFGCVLYEAATRRRPFAAETEVETMHRILHDKPTPVEDLNPKAPAELRRVIRRCLAKSADQRLQSMKDLAIELREIVDEYEALSAAASSGTIAGVAPAAPARRSPIALWIGAGLVAIAGIAVAWWGLQRGGKESQPFQNMRMTTQTNRGDVFDCVISPDGRYLAYLTGTAGRASLRVRQVATGSDVEVTPATDAGLRSPSFSPDGNYLFYLATKPDARDYRALFQVPSLGGSPRELTFDVDSRVTFEPTGRQVAFWRRVPQAKESRLILFDLEAGKERVLTSVPYGEFFRGDPAWSPDGRRIAVMLLKPAPDLRATIALFDVGNGRRQDHVKLERTVLDGIAWLPDGSGLVANGADYKVMINSQLFLIAYPGAQVRRITNDFSEYSGVSVSGGTEAIAAVRKTSLCNLWMADATGGAPRQITTITNPENSPFDLTVTDSSTLAFASARDQAAQIWTIDAVGGEARVLTSGAGQSINPSGAAGVVVFDRLDPSGIHIWCMNADGSGVRQLTSGAGEQAGWLSPDGRWVAFIRYDSLRSVSLLSVENGQVTHFASEVSASLGFSPDGQQFLIGRPEQDSRGLSRTLWEVVPVPGGAPVASVRLPGQSDNPAWAPDGRGVAFLSTTDPARNVYRQGLDGGSPKAVTHFTEGRVTQYGWSPDGSRLAVVRRIGAASNLWIIDADGGPVQVTPFTSETIFEFRWLPDSRRIAVAAGTESSDAVLIRNFR